MEKKKKIFMIAGIVLSAGIITAGVLFFLLHGRNKGGNENTTAPSTEAAESTTHEEEMKPEEEPGIQARLTLSADRQEVAEGGAITYTSEIDCAPESDIKVTLSNGETIIIKAGETQGSVTVGVRSDDPYKQGDEIVSAKITGVTQDSSKSGIEKIIFDDTPVKTVVTDGDGTNASIVTLSIDQTGVTEDAAMTYTASISNAPKGNITVMLSSGQTVTIKGGETRSSVTAAVRADDAYKQGIQTVSVSITGVTQDTAEGGLESITFGPAAVSAAVNDNSTSSAVSLKADVSDIVEGKGVTYTASITSAPKNSIQVYLDNGKTITIHSGQKSGSIKVDVRKDDLYKQGKETLAVKISGVTQDSAADGLESVTYDTSAVRTIVSDNEDEAKVTLSADKIAVFEGTGLTYTAVIDHAPKGAVTVTLDNGRKITIKGGQTSGTLKTEIRKDDAYKQGDETLEVKIKKVSADSAKDGLEKITFDTKSVSTKIYDDDDASKVTLKVDRESAVEGEKLTYTAEIDNAPKSDITVSLDNGKVITIKAGKTSGKVSADTRADDVYKQGEEIVEVKIANVTQDSADDGLESIEPDGTAVKTAVTDDESTSTVTLSVDRESAAEGETLTYTAAIDNAPKSDLTVSLDNGETVTIKAEKTEGNITVGTREDDPYTQDDETLTVQITAVTQDGAEYGLEKVAFNDTSVSTAVADDSDASTAKLKVSQSDEAEDGKMICAAEVDHAPQTDLTLTLSNGVEFTIRAEETKSTSGSFVYDPSAEITLKEYQGGGYEELVVEISVFNPPVLTEKEIAVDEALLAGGNAENAGGHEVSGTGSFSVSMNGKETETVQISSEGSNIAITLHKDGAADIAGGAVTVNGVAFTVTGVSQTDDNYTVSYSYKLTGAQTHSDPAKFGENDTLKGSLDILVTDESGDKAKSTLSVLVHDDGPDVTNMADASVSVTVDEADFADGTIEHASASSDIVDADNLFDIRPGADGESGKTYGLSLLENGKVRGVIYERNNGHTVTDDDGNPVPVSAADGYAFKALYGGAIYDVTLMQNGDDTVSGMIDISQGNGGTQQVEIFRVSVDGEGHIQLTQYRHMEVTGGASICHAAGQTKVDEISLENMIAVSVTSLDNDGDTAADSVPVSVAFRDDGLRVLGEQLEMQGGEVTHGNAEAVWAYFKEHVNQDISADIQKVVETSLVLLDKEGHLTDRLPVNVRCLLHDVDPSTHFQTGEAREYGMVLVQDSPSVIKGYALDGEGGAPRTAVFTAWLNNNNSAARFEVKFEEGASLLHREGDTLLDEVTVSRSLKQGDNGTGSIAVKVHVEDYDGNTEEYYAPLNFTSDDDRPTVWYKEAESIAAAIGTGSSSAAALNSMFYNGQSPSMNNEAIIDDYGVNIRVGRDGLGSRAYALGFADGISITEKEKGERVYDPGIQVLYDGEASNMMLILAADAQSARAVCGASMEHTLMDINIVSEGEDKGRIAARSYKDGARLIGEAGANVRLDDVLQVSLTVFDGDGDAAQYVLNNVCMDSGYCKLQLYLGQAVSGLFGKD